MIGHIFLHDLYINDLIFEVSSEYYMKSLSSSKSSKFISSLWPSENYQIFAIPSKIKCGDEITNWQQASFVHQGLKHHILIAINSQCQ